MIIKGITIHNTNSELSAREIADDLIAQQKINLCHYLVDEQEVINIYPVEYEASHTGRGFDFGNKYTIAIEICRSQCKDDLYFKSQDRAIKLIKYLMKKYSLTKDDIYFHNDFNTVRCPHRILEIYQTKERFINECII